MARTTETRVIDGWTYEVYLLPPKQAIKILTRLTKLISEPLGLAAGGFIEAKRKGPKAKVRAVPAEGLDGLADVDLSQDMIGRVVSAFANRLDDDEVIDTIEVLLDKVHVQTDKDQGPRKINFNVDFMGRTLSVLKVTAFALEVNFADFFGESGVSGLIAQAQAAAGLK